MDCGKRRIQMVSSSAYTNSVMRKDVLGVVLDLLQRVLVPHWSPSCFCGFSKALHHSWETTFCIFKPAREVLFCGFPELVDHRCAPDLYVDCDSLLRSMPSLPESSVFQLLTPPPPPRSVRQFWSWHCLILPFPGWHQAEQNSRWSLPSPMSPHSYLERSLPCPFVNGPITSLHGVLCRPAEVCLDRIHILAVLNPQVSVWMCFQFTWLCI